MGGMVSGAILGAVHGGLEGALKGAAIGFVVGAYMGMGVEAFGAGFAIAAAIGGAAYAGATGGLEGLGDFAAGVAGSFAGHHVGQSLVGGMGLGNTQASKGQKSIKSKPAVKQAVKRGGFEETRAAVKRESGKPSGLIGNETGEVIADAGASGTAGSGQSNEVLFESNRVPFSGKSFRFAEVSMRHQIKAALNTDKTLELSFRTIYKVVVKLPIFGEKTFSYEKPWHTFARVENWSQPLPSKVDALPGIDEFIAELEKLIKF